MVKYNVHYSPSALRDLDTIWAYITYDLENPVAANNTVSRLLDAADSLNNNANRGKQLFLSDGYYTGYRWILNGNHFVFYHVQEHDVYIVRVLYSRSDYMSILFPEA